MTTVSIIIPVRNGEMWIKSCFTSILVQNTIPSIKLEVVVYNDGSNDSTEQILSEWEEQFEKKGIEFIMSGSPQSRGVGAAKNSAVALSTGQYLCFQDVDDTMHPNRISLQLQRAVLNHNAIVGSKITRIPIDSTPRLVRWANNLSDEELKLQIYTANGPTLLMPTWFCHRSVFTRVGGFVETGCGTPEDLIFFYSHVDHGGDLVRINEELVTYTYHNDAATFSVTRERIWNIQIERLQTCILPNWKRFTVWNAGKAGRRFVRSLNKENLNKLEGFCDVDKKKIGTTVEFYCPIKRAVLINLPVVHFSKAKPPFIICVKLDLTNGEFEQNLKSLNLTEGKDYVLFS